MLQLQRRHWLTYVLLILLLAVQAQLWLGRGSFPDVVSMRAKIKEQIKTNDEMRLKNSQLQAEVSDLKGGVEMLEERARFELGMIKPGEIFVQLR